MTSPGDPAGNPYRSPRARDPRLEPPPSNIGSWVAMVIAVVLLAGGQVAQQAGYGAVGIAAMAVGGLALVAVLVRVALRGLKK